MADSSTDAFVARFGRAVRRAREARDLSVRAAAALLGLPPSALQLIEAGERDTSVSTAVRIARKLGLSIDELGRL